MQNVILQASLPLVFASTEAPAQPGGISGGTIQFVFIGLMIAAMWFLMIAPQRKKQKEHQKMMSALTSGDEVLTVGGIYGTVTNVKDDRLVVRIAEGTKVEVGRAFVQTVLKKASSGS